MEKLETKRVGDVMYQNAGLKNSILARTGHTILDRAPKIVKVLTDGGFSVSMELLKELLTAKIPGQSAEIKGEDYPFTAAEAASIACPLLDEQIDQRTQGLNEFLVESAKNKLYEVKAKALGKVYQTMQWLMLHSGNLGVELDYFFQVVEFKDGELLFVKDYSKKLDELTSVRFKTQAAVDIYNQHIRAYEEMEKLYSLINNNFIKCTQCQPETFVNFQYGEIGFPTGLNYELLAKKGR